MGAKRLRAANPQWSSGKMVRENTPIIQHSLDRCQAVYTVYFTPTEERASLRVSPSGDGEPLPGAQHRPLGQVNDSAFHTLNMAAQRTAVKRNLAGGEVKRAQG